LVIVDGDHILADPVYAGTAYANRYDYVPSGKPRRDRGTRNHKPLCRRLKPREQWIAVSVPALVDMDTWEKAQTQLARNSVLSFRHNSKYNYLLRCLLTCKTCGLAMFGRAYRATASQQERRFYLCHGKDCILTARPTACPSRSVKAEELEAAVWEHVVDLLSDPERLLAQFEHFGVTAEAGTLRDSAADQQLQARLERTARADKRLLDAYQAGAISLDELSERRSYLAEERRSLVHQQQERDRLRQKGMQVEAIRSNLTAFCGRIGTRLHEATFADKQAILQLVIERIIVGEGSLEIRHVIPLLSRPPGGSGAPASNPPLRSDRGQVAPLPARVVRLPFAPQPRDHRRRQVRGILAQQRPKRLLEVAHRHPAQVEHRQQRIQARRPPRPAWQDARGEADALGGLTSAAVAQLHPPHRDRADPGLHLALGAMPVSHQALPPVRQRHALHRRQERLGFRLDGLGQQPAGTAPQDRCQRVIGLLGPPEWDNCGMAHRGVSLLREVLAGSSPASIRHLSQTAVTQFRP
jgi:hypothetical protein